MWRGYTGRQPGWILRSVSDGAGIERRGRWPKVRGQISAAGRRRSKNRERGGGEGRAPGFVGRRRTDRYHAPCRIIGGEDRGPNRAVSIAAGDRARWMWGGLHGGTEGAS